MLSLSIHSSRSGMICPQVLILFFLIAFGLNLLDPSIEAAEETSDVVIYEASPEGIMAAVAAVRNEVNALGSCPVDSHSVKTNRDEKGTVHCDGYVVYDVVGLGKLP